ncbi:DsrE family protein, partial [Pontibacterium sp.]
YGKSGSNLAEGFELSGLGQLADAIAHSDRVITFGA